MKTRAGIGGIAVVLLLAGCTNAPSALPESEYFDLVSELETLQSTSEESLRTLGGNVCDAMKSDSDDNAAYVNTLKALLDGGMEAGEAGEFIVYSTSTYCTDQVGRIPR